MRPVLIAGKKNIMDIRNIYKNLCYYDQRHPDFSGAAFNNDRCYCDNCMYMRTPLANKLIEAYEAIHEFTSRHDITTGGIEYAPTQKEIENLKSILTI